MFSCNKDKEIINLDKTRISDGCDDRKEVETIPELVDELNEQANCGQASIGCEGMIEYEETFYTIDYPGVVPHPGTWCNPGNPNPNCDVCSPPLPLLFTISIQDELLARAKEIALDLPTPCGNSAKEITYDFMWNINWDPSCTPEQPFRFWVSLNVKIRCCYLATSDT